ncbi:piggyBac transposable element-derived protein 4-like isoform X2 [Alosa sapidissima]|nr:piggyBac transposable element-derived protein 4-like isoform X2 [Alosa sapidissima]
MDLAPPLSSGCNVTEALWGDLGLLVKEEDMKEEEYGHMVACPDVEEEKPFAELHCKTETDVTDSNYESLQTTVKIEVKIEEDEHDYLLKKPMCRRHSSVANGRDLGEAPGPSGASSTRCSADSSDSDNEFSEPDPDSSDEWLPSGSAEYSRASSPYVAPETHEGGRASSGDDWHQAGWQPNNFPFTATPGPRKAAAELDSDLPADFLELFLTDELLRHIVDQTNLYASQYFEARRPGNLPYSRVNAWKPVSVPELKTFFGLSFLTGYIKKPSLELYWSVDEVDATPHFSKTMSRNRFQIIWSFLHYNNNALQDETDKMYKVRPVLDYIVEKFKEMYQSGQNICIDEGMMQWRGRLSFKVYNPQKVKYGIKSYILCDSATGYCFNMRPYIGEDSTVSEIVFSLLDRLPGHGYTLFMDHFYNSVALCERLLGAQTNVCGTLRKDRGEPQLIGELTKTDLRMREKVVRHNERVMVVAWQDKRLVKMVTTCHQDRMQKVNVWQRGRKVSQYKPECIVAYNSSMNGVDKLDQNIAYYPFVRRSLNWANKFVAYLFQLCMFNAYVLYQARNPGECKTLLEFIRRVVKSEEGRRTPRAPYNTDPDSRLDGELSRHKLERLMPTSKKGRPSRRCRVCARKGRRSETKMCCKSCGVPLHAGECFTAYHTKLNYSV